MLDSFWYYFVNMSDPHGRWYIEDQDMNLIASGIPGEEIAKYICKLQNDKVMHDTVYGSEEA